MAEFLKVLWGNLDRVGHIMVLRGSEGFLLFVSEGLVGCSLEYLDSVAREAGYVPVMRKYIGDDGQELIEEGVVAERYAKYFILRDSEVFNSSTVSVSGIGVVETADLIAVYRADVEARDAVFARVLEYYKEYGCFNGETICQMDDPQIYAPGVLADIADSILQFEVTYKG